MRITLNLATRPFADLGPATRRLRVGMGVLALIAVLLGLGLHAIHRKAEIARARDHSLDGQIAQINQERQGYQQMMQQPANAQLLKQAAVLNKLFDEKAFSWTLAMMDLETVLPGGVQVSTLAPERGKDGRITVHMRVIGPRNRAVDLVRNLEHSRRFLLPRIVGENAETTERPGQPLQPVSEADRVDFDLLANYNPASAEERIATRKASKKSPDGEKTTSSDADHPAAQHGGTHGRPPYAGMARPGSLHLAKPSPLNQAPKPGGPQ